MKELTPKELEEWRKKLAIRCAKPTNRITMYRTFGGYIAALTDNGEDILDGGAPCQSQEAATTLLMARVYGAFGVMLSPERFSVQEKIR